MRPFVLAFALLMALIWLGAAIWAARQVPPFDAAGLHGIGFLFIVPALVMAASGVWLRVALGLLCAAAFIYFSVLVAGQISN